MSFRCDLCKRPMPNGSSPTKVVFETRNKVYPERTIKNSENPGYRPKVIDRGGEGWEIVKEANLCRRCIRDLQEENKARENKNV